MAWQEFVGEIWPQIKPAVELLVSAFVVAVCDALRKHLQELTKAQITQKVVDAIEQTNGDAHNDVKLALAKTALRAAKVNVSDVDIEAAVAKKARKPKQGGA